MLVGSAATLVSLTQTEAAWRLEWIYTLPDFPLIGTASVQASEQKTDWRVSTHWWPSVSPAMRPQVLAGSAAPLENLFHTAATEQLEWTYTSLDLSFAGTASDPDTDVESEYLPIAERVVAVCMTIGKQMYSYPPIRSTRSRPT